MRHHSTSSSGFLPVARADAERLILGSLPGRHSLAAHEYYAHPRNAFWPIMDSLYGIRGAYAARCEQLKKSRIALWDVVEESVRPGSMDADIRTESTRANDFAAFFATHTEVRLIGFNGKTAASLFRRLVLPELGLGDIRLVTLPSTSPAYAAMPVAVKRERWYTQLSLDGG